MWVLESTQRHQSRVGSKTFAVNFWAHIDRQEIWFLTSFWLKMTMLPIKVLFAKALKLEWTFILSLHFCRSSREEVEEKNNQSLADEAEKTNKCRWGGARCTNVFPRFISYILLCLTLSYLYLTSYFARNWLFLLWQEFISIFGHCLMSVFVFKVWRTLMIKTKKMLDFVRNKNPGKFEPSLKIF